MVETHLIFGIVALVLLLPFYTKAIGSLTFFYASWVAWFVGFIIAYKMSLEIWMAVYLAGLLYKTYSIGGYWAVVKLIKKSMERMKSMEEYFRKNENKK